MYLFILDSSRRRKKKEEKENKDTNARCTIHADETEKGESKKTGNGRNRLKPPKSRHTGGLGYYQILPWASREQAARRKIPSSLGSLVLGLFCLPRQRLPSISLGL